VGTNGVVRPSTLAGDGSKGVTFYLTGTGAGNHASVYFGSNSGHAQGGHTIASFSTSNAICPGGTAPPADLALPTAVDGNVLLGPCTGKGTYIGATLNTQAETSGSVRGMLFYQDRANADADNQAQPNMNGGGGLVLSGNMYFHNCNSSGTGTGCSDPPAGFRAFLQLQGNSGGNAYVLGNITADELVLGGTGSIKMLLNPNSVINVLKVTMLE